jgi:hypothetical protein
MNKHKIIFLCPPIVLAIVTWIWLFYKDGRWYEYHFEWPWLPLFLLHLVLPLFYLTAFIVSIIRHSSKEKRGTSEVFYIVSSIILFFFCCIGFLAYLVFTSGL